MNNKKLDKHTQKIVDDKVKEEMVKQKRKEQLEKMTSAQKDANNEFVLKISKKALKILGIIAAVVFGGGLVVVAIMYIIPLFFTI